jgi:hypothetical protein
MLGIASLCLPVFCLAVGAQNGSDYHTGRLLSITDRSYAWPLDGSAGPAYVLHIQDGPNLYFALYTGEPMITVKQLSGHEDGPLKPETDIQYRIWGKTLFLKTSQDRKVTKTRLCDMVKFQGVPGVKCGAVTFF